MELRPGIRVDRYVLLAPLGRGAQGSVWRVRDPLDGAEKALKLFELTALSQHGAERARREAQAVAKVKHPAIVACHALFELPAEERLGLVFDLVLGRSLAEAARDVRMTPLHRDALLVQIAAALEHVHAHGIVHRDLKPANVLVADTFWAAPHAPGSVKLADFGIAAAVGNPRGLTATGAFIGTRPYLAPDILLPGRWGPSSEGCARDVFAFGVLAWELLTHEHPTGLPFDAPIEKYVAAYRDAAEGRRRWPPPDLPSPRAHVIRACIELDPASRPKDGAALVVGLQTGAVPLAPPAGSVLAMPTETKEPQTEIDSARRDGIPATRVSVREVPASTATMTTPMPGLLPYSSPPSHSFAKHDRPQRRSAARSIAAGIIGAVLLASVVSYLLMAHAVLETRAPTPPPQSPSAGRSTAPDVDPPAPIPCCVGAGPCRSGRPCARSGCANLLPDRWWRVRITGVGMRSIEQIRSGPADAFPEDLSGTHPAGRVCLRRVADPSTQVCGSLKKASRTRDGDWDDRLRVRTSDLEASGLEIWIEDGGMELTRGISASNPRGISTSVLCRGMSLYVGSRDTARARVYAFLDDG